MTRILGRAAIQATVARLAPSLVMDELESAFISYSAGRTIVPPVGVLQYDNPRGDVHIKYGMISGHPSYLVKVASSVYSNPAQGLSSSNGVMLIFSVKTGQLLTILLDEGYLTDFRTAVAGGIAAKHLAPTSVNTIGILGTGVQARAQLRFLTRVVPCRGVAAWGRSEHALNTFIQEMRDEGQAVFPASSVRDVLQQSQLVVTTTASTRPLITADMLHPGLHITALGADAPGKQELDSRVLEQADIVVVDSLSQCIDHGDSAYAVRDGLIVEDRLVELGSWIAEGRARNGDSEISVADLTGVAVQDIAIANLVAGTV